MPNYNLLCIITVVYGKVSRTPEILIEIHKSTRNY